VWLPGRAQPQPDSVSRQESARLCCSTADVCALSVAVQEPASVLLRQWEPLLLQWPLLGPAARQDLVSRLASSDLMFFLALKDRTAFDEVCCSIWLA
jgi:hypothetical protein